MSSTKGRCACVSVCVCVWEKVQLLLAKRMSQTEALLTLYKVRQGTAKARRRSVPRQGSLSRSLFAQQAGARSLRSTHGERAMGLQVLFAVLFLLQLSRPGSPQEQGSDVVRLCGRDFVRAVIFTCGGSRWKRISPQGQPGVAQPPRADFVQISSNKEPENNNLLSVLDPVYEQLRSMSRPAGQRSLKDLFNLYDDYTESVPPSDNFNEYIRQAEDAAHKRGGETGLASLKGLNSFPGVKHPRRKRDPATRLLQICCTLGCTQDELSQLC